MVKAAGETSPGRRPCARCHSGCMTETTGSHTPMLVIDRDELRREVQAKYAGYIDRQEREIAKQAKQESLRLPVDIAYSAVDGLSNEARQRLELARPVTLGQASRLEGMTPSAVSLLLIHIKKRQLKKSA